MSPRVRLGAGFVLVALFFALTSFFVVTLSERERLQRVDEARRQSRLDRAAASARGSMLTEMNAMGQSAPISKEEGGMLLVSEIGHPFGCAGDTACIERGAAECVSVELPAMLPASEVVQNLGSEGDVVLALEPN